MRKLIVTEWVSLDGTFDANLMEQWFNPYHSESRAEYIQETIQNCEIMLYGRKTYEMLYPYWSSLKNNEMGVADKLNKTKKYVVSGSLQKAVWENSIIINENVLDEISKLKQEEGGAILIQGSGDLLASLLTAGLVNELKILVQPHIMGTGRHLFSGEINVKLELIHTQKLDRGVLALSYRPINNQS